MTRSAVAARRRPLWWGILLTLAGWAVVCVPVFWALVLASWGFSGCFIECSTPDPALGLLAVAAATVMVLTPVMAGIALVRGSRAWWIGTACAAGAVLVPLAYMHLAGAA